MLNNFKYALRYLWRNKTNSLLNIAGLSFGIASVLLLYLFIRHELSYDSFHTKKDDIYRVCMSVERGGKIRENSGSPFPLQKEIKERFSQVEESTLVFAHWGGTFIVDPDKGEADAKKFRLYTGTAFMQPSFYEMFDFKWIIGDYKKVLSEPGSAAISKSLAEKYFGASQGNYADVIGRHMRMDGMINLTVNGVIEDPPDNSDFPFQVVISQVTHYNITPGFYENWMNINHSVNTYVLLKKGSGPENFRPQLTALSNEKYSGNPAVKVGFFLQPLSDIHFNGQLVNYNFRVMNKNTLYALGFIAVFLILTACVNFINLSVALAAKRSKEIGIKKTLGAGRASIFSYYMSEVSVTVFIAAVISVMLAEMSVPFLSRALKMNITYNSLSDYQAALFLAGLSVLTIIAAGIYPSFLLSGSAPVKAIKGEIREGGVKSGLFLRRSLVVFQFALSEALIVCVLVISGQIDFIQTKDLGFDKENILFFEVPDSETFSKDYLYNSIMNLPSVKEASFSLNPPSSDGGGWNTALAPEDNRNFEVRTEMKPIDENFIKLYGLKLLAGRNLTPKDSLDCIIINENLMRQAGITDPQKAIGFGFYRSAPYMRMRVIGVVKDFYAGPLYREMPALAMTTINPPNNAFGMIANVKLNKFKSAEEMQSALNDIRKIWEKAFPSEIYTGYFLDDTINSYYESEERMASIMSFFTTIAILIGCIGLYGLISFMAAQRTKEIGVRKVLGASVSGIVTLLSKEFMILLGISFIIAWPTSYYYMSKWIEHYPERITLGPGIFIPAAFIAFAISAATISYRAIKAAAANPVKSLKYE